MSELIVNQLRGSLDGQSAHRLGNNRSIVVTPQSWENLSSGARLSILGRRLRAAAAAHRRDNWALMQVAHYVEVVMDYNPDAFMQYQKNPAEPKNFRAQRYCGSMRYEQSGITAAVLTDQTQSVVHSHLEHCGSVAVCPVCAAKIQTRRRDEVQTAIEYARSQGWRVAMMTLTAHHTAQDSLNSIVDRFGRAWRSFQQSRPWRRVRAESIHGMIRAAEVTQSARNGWHYHYHVILFLDGDHLPDIEELRDVWVDRLVRFGFCGETLNSYNDALCHAFHWDFLSDDHADAVSRYVNKMASEATLSITKVGKKPEHRTPFGILADMVTVDDTAAFNRDLHLFAEYALATKGLNWLVWSRGLKNKVGVQEITDEEICTDHAEKVDEVLWGLTSEHWTALARSGMTGTYLRDVASCADFEKTVNWFRSAFPSLAPIVPPDRAAALYDEQTEKDARRRSGDHPADSLDEEEQEAMRVDYEQGRRTHYRVLAAHGDADASRRYDEMIDLDVPF